VLLGAMTLLGLVRLLHGPSAGGETDPPGARNWAWRELACRTGGL
jgi:hypothetical protein